MNAPLNSTNSPAAIYSMYEIPAQFVALFATKVYIYLAVNDPTVCIVSTHVQQHLTRDNMGSRCLRL